ncbi:hypothetical protein BDV96DRAFT_639243 [Lophiotrema nucula]|uniref:Argonaute linker 1 domain-containing protein n=1 Tax=Lophiotrema nucula TaxID=690887 RepID=A0A6A5ZSM9_9PLEO|nr:hypothetical protein BDV96DRAFT_639243 [Lophiotrema nucula]
MSYMNDADRNSITSSLEENRLPCFRCGFFKHGTLECKEAKGQGFQHAASKLKGKIDADDWYFTERDRMKTEQARKKKEAKEAKAAVKPTPNADPRKGKGPTLGRPTGKLPIRKGILDKGAMVKNPGFKIPASGPSGIIPWGDEVPSKGGLPYRDAPGNAFSEGSAAPPSLTPHADEKQGKLHQNQLGKPTKTDYRYTKVNSPIQGTAKGGICTASGATGKDDLLIMSNYVEVNDFPDNIYVYNLTYWYPESSGPNGRITFNKRLEIRKAFNALNQLDSFHLQSNNVIWATDFKTLYCASAIHDTTTQVSDWDTSPVRYEQVNGVNIDGLQATISVGTCLTNIRQAFKTKEITELYDYIRALNANISRAIVPQTAAVPASNQEPQLTQIGPNKFFINGGFAQMTGLRAVRGYFTSIRPGAYKTLLNVNTATSAFFEPILLSDFLDKVGTVDSESSIEKMLRGVTLRITYTRQHFEGKPDPNTPANRLKTFRQFGLVAGKQKFFKLTKKTIGKKVKWESSSTDGGKDVATYFETGKNVEKFTTRYTTRNQLLCVNVGKPVTPHPPIDP